MEDRCSYIILLNVLTIPFSLYFSSALLNQTMMENVSTLSITRLLKEVSIDLFKLNLFRSLKKYIRFDIFLKT